jgi:hypothetical protein
MVQRLREHLNVRKGVINPVPPGHITKNIRRFAITNVLMITLAALIVIAHHAHRTA